MYQISKETKRNEILDLRSLLSTLYGPNIESHFYNLPILLLSDNIIFLRIALGILPMYDQFIRDYGP